MNASRQSLALSLLLMACSIKPDTRAPSPDARVTEADGSCKPQILSDSESRGDIPDFVARLTQAYCNADASVCASLPTPTPQVFDQGDYQTSAPSRKEWLGYCEALAAADPLRCESIDSPSQPNLRSNCEDFFQQLAAPGNDSPAFCLAQMGITYHSADEVRNCLLPWAFPIYGHVTAEQCMATTAMAPFTQLDHDLFCCLQLPRASTLTEGQPDQQTCLFALAQSSKNDRVCLLIEDPYASNPQSLPSCQKALEK